MCSINIWVNKSFNDYSWWVIIKVSMWRDSIRIMIKGKNSGFWLPGFDFCLQHSPSVWTLAIQAFFLSWNYFIYTQLQWYNESQLFSDGFMYYLFLHLYCKIFEDEVHNLGCCSLIVPPPWGLTQCWKFSRYYITTWWLK